MTEIQKYVQAMALPPGVNITSHPRCGDTDRQRASDRITEAYARGFLDKGEAEARNEAIGAATLAAHLDQLTADLPGMTRWSGRSMPDKRKENLAKRWTDWWQDRQPVSSMLGLIGSGVGGVTPGVAVQMAGIHWLTPLIVGLTAPVAIIGFVFSIASLVIHYD